MNEQINLKINKFLEELNKSNKKKVGPDKMAAAINMWNIDPTVYYTYGMTNKDIGL